MQAISQPLLLLEQTEPTTIAGTLVSGDFVVFSARCPGHDGPNEDAAGVFPGSATTVLAVADGLGGGRSGHVASRLAVEHTKPLSSWIINRYQMLEEASARARLPWPLEGGCRLGPHE